MKKGVSVFPQPLFNSPPTIVSTVLIQIQKLCGFNYYSNIPSFHHSIIPSVLDGKQHPSGVKSKPGPPGQDSLLIFRDVVAFCLKFGEKRLKTGAVKEKLLWKRDERFIGHG
jgi:hypothetical protein